MNWLWMLVGTYLLYATAMVFLHPQIIYPFGTDQFENPTFEQVTVGTRGVHLAVAGGDNDPAVLFFMGNGGSLAYFTDTLVTHQNAGRAVVAMEYRGGGGVAGKPSETALKADALAAYDWMVQTHGGPIAVHGYSLGTGLALHVAARRDVAAIILDAPYRTLCRLMTERSLLPACYMPAVQKWRSVDDIPAISVPILIQHGTADELIPLKEGAGLADLMRAQGLDVTFTPISGATHNNLAGQSGYGDRISAFLRAAMPHP